MVRGVGTESTAVSVDALCGVCGEFGVRFDEVSPGIQARMTLLAEATETISDCTRIAKRAQQVFEYLEQHDPERAFSDLEKRIVVIGSLFADIGKTGPAHADANGQQLVVDMFSVEGVRNDKQPVSEFLSTYFPDDALARLRQFVALGLDPEMSMRDFWNLHAGWTLDIVRDGGVPAEAIAAAASHHLLENINPRDIVAEDGRFSTNFGDNLAFDRPEKLVILLDKYDALRRRSRGTHEAAIVWLDDLLQRHPTFQNDVQFALLLEAMDHALRDSDD